MDWCAQWERADMGLGEGLGGGPQSLRAVLAPLSEADKRRAPQAGSSVCDQGHRAGAARRGCQPRARLLCLACAL